MTGVTPPDGRSQAGEAPGAGPSALDEATKRLVQQLVAHLRRQGGPNGAHGLDWDAIWSLAESGPSDELGLGSAVLAAEEALSNDQPTAPSAYLVHPGRDRPGVRRQLRVRVPELPKSLRRAVAGATWLRNIGIIVVLFAVWQLWGTGIAEAHSQGQLGAKYQLLVRQAEPSVSHGASNHLPTPAGSTQAASMVHAGTTAFVESALPGGVLGRIRIPSIGVNDYFVQGVGEAQLQEGPGRYPGSGLPGQPGNLAIAGHRTTYGAPFFRLGELRVGDKVLIDVPQGRAIYTVSQRPFAVSPYDVDVLDDFGDARLTLTTCNPPFFATTRLIVVAELREWLPIGAKVPVVVQNPGPAVHRGLSASVSLVSLHHAQQRLVDLRPQAWAARDVAAQAAMERQAHAENKPSQLSEGAGDNPTVGQGLADEGAGWHLGKLPVVAGVVVALCALGALYGRVARLCTGATRWLVMAPMWAAGLLALFKVLGLLLPSDL